MYRRTLLVIDNRHAHKSVNCRYLCLFSECQRILGSTRPRHRIGSLLPPGVKGNHVSVITEVSPLFFSYIICIAFVFFPLSFKNATNGSNKGSAGEARPHIYHSSSFQLEVDAMTSQSWHSLAASGKLLFA